MSVKVFGRSSSAEPAQAPVENVNWLPRARLRSGGRGDRLLTALIVVTASVLAAAAGFAAWSRHGDFLPLQTTATEKAPERVAAAPVRQTTPAPAPVRNVTEAPSIPAAPASPSLSGARNEPPPEASGRSTLRAEPASQAAPAAPVTTIRTNPAGVPIESGASAPAAVALAPPVEPAPAPDAAPPIPPAPPPAPPLPLASAGRPVSSAPLTNFSAGSFEVLPALIGESPAPSPAPARERPEPPPPRTASAPPPPSSSSGARVAVYLDEYPDQKAAAAALSQKSGAYGKVIGSAGRLTYTRRGNDWRLRVSNLDQATAEALCAKLKGAGAPCSVGPN